jgi:hypothetical protein
LNWAVTRISLTHGRYITCCPRTCNIRWRAFWRNMSCCMLHNFHCNVCFGHLVPA